jgi:hypothetical protein
VSSPLPSHSVSPPPPPTARRVHRYGSDGYGFHILSEDRPLVTLAFATWEDAEQARDEVARAVERAVEITPHASAKI